MKRNKKTKKCILCNKTKMKGDLNYCIKHHKIYETEIIDNVECDARAKADYFSVGGSDF